MCLTYNLKAPFEKLPIFPLVNYQQLGSRRNWLWFRALVPWRLRNGGTSPSLATLPLLALPTNALSSTLTLTTKRMWNLFSTVST